MATCDHCKSEAARFRCSSCKCRYYCDSSCSKLNWKNHKEDCKGQRASNIAFDQKQQRSASRLHKLMSITDEDICCICLESLNAKGNAFILPCDHFLCNVCLLGMPGELWCDSETGEILDEESPKCPQCRQRLPGVIKLFQYLYEMAVEFVTCARQLPMGSTGRDDYCLQARNQIDKIENTVQILSVDGSSKFVQFLLLLEILKIDVFLVEGNATEVIFMATYLLQKEPEESLQIVLHDFLGDAHVILGNFNAAQLAYKSAFKLVGDQDYKYVKETRKIFHQMSRCLYELGEYDKAIVAAECAVSMNRHYNGVYKYYALSYKMKGDLDKAIAIMRQAVSYEAPWDENNLKVVTGMLAELEEEKRQLQDVQQEGEDISAPSASEPSFCDSSVKNPT